MTILKNTTVTYTDHDGSTQTGIVSRTSIKTGRKLYRVNDRWFERGALSEQ